MYILCRLLNGILNIFTLGFYNILFIFSGTPPFFVSPGHRSNISTGMKNRIKLGQYSLRDRCWQNVSDEAKVMRMIIIYSLNHEFC